jgi:Ca2+-transporting ATPase
MPEPASLPVGLNEDEAAARLRTEGYNELPQERRRNFLRIVGEVLREPMFALLIGAGLVYVILGDLTESLILLVFASASVSIAVIQEQRGERVLQSLRDLTSPRALVVRGGERRRIPGREVVRGDVVILCEGDRVPADAKLIATNDLLTDESLLTGESLPVQKDATVEASVYAGTLVVRGDGVGVVSATGLRSEIGKIGRALRSIELEPPRLRMQTRKIVRNFGLAGIAVSVAVTLLYGLARDAWLPAVLAGIAMGMAMLPEEFPLVLTVFMVMGGARRLARARVLTRRAAAIETLGSATVLCTDKTGTLTENRMRVAALHDGVQAWNAIADDDVPDAFRELIVTAALASTEHP